MKASDPPPDMAYYYGCVRCQREHWSGTDIYREHIGFQSKHGVQQASPALRARALLRRQEKEE